LSAGGESALEDWSDSLLAERDTFNGLGLEAMLVTGRNESGVLVVEMEADERCKSSREEEICRFARREDRNASYELSLVNGKLGE
jgi:hypothetical protein